MKGNKTLLVLAAIPLLVLVWWIKLYYIDCPVFDEWAIAPLLEKSYEGTLTFSDLWAQHNEHRPLFPRIVLLLLARWSNWNIAYELAVNVLLGIAIFGILLYQIKRYNFQDSRLTLILSLIVFSLNQSENWFLGWQVEVFINVLAVVSGIVLLSGYTTTWFRIGVAALLGLLATYSFANGLAFWPVAFALLFLRKESKSKLIVWAILSTATLISYLYQYSKPEHHPSMFVPWEHPLTYAHYVLTYLGSPLLAFSRKFTAATYAPALVGLLGILIATYAPVVIIRQQHLKIGQIMPFLAFISYAIVSAALSGLGRADLGAINALSLRYVTITSLLWISNAVFLYVLSTRNRNLRKTATIGLLSIIFLIALNSIYGGLYIRKLHSYLSPAREELRVLQNDELLSRLHYSARLLRQDVEILKKYRLSVFRE